VRAMQSEALVVAVDTDYSDDLLAEIARDVQVAQLPRVCPSIGSGTEKVVPTSQLSKIRWRSRAKPARPWGARCSARPWSCTSLPA
jgi:hypothetical protein